ncbi:hypothetical protein [Phyllobacterium endophyticum]|uniref:RiboL-PSP-HEPN domain-containing protein n=1 Tax=Phyllobacterium endophyticum TaxID=1149773 RepID=A0A2P7AUW8_9HYPH|nr:hypothetical protein [Phyllobacterium endophyticum]MBB3234538.1 hypothetical protein [Phyllobacterium endophyticum]PSH58022.1 hypothetical protein CU100_10165 [Phyllobacterium endophyticum]TYR38690.1 hypothetical protein FY050_22125 [Phyllobacterium endophyticum]
MLDNSENGKETPKFTTGYNEEFSNIDLLLKNSKSSKLGVDIFCLSWIKAERQMRKLFMCLAYQSDLISALDSPTEKTLMEDHLRSARVYLGGFRVGIEDLSGLTLQALVGPNYNNLNRAIENGKTLRDKVFHGQISDSRYDTQQLINLADEIRQWCQNLAVSAHEQIGYDGFEDKALRKLNKVAFNDLSSRKVGDLEGFKNYLRGLKDYR